MLREGGRLRDGGRLRQFESEDEVDLVGVVALSPEELRMLCQSFFLAVASSFIQATLKSRDILE